MLKYLKSLYKEHEKTIDQTVDVTNKVIKNGIDNFSKSCNVVKKIIEGEEMVTDVLQIKNNGHRFRQTGEIEKVRGFNLEEDDKLIINFKNEETLKIKYKDLKNAFHNESQELYRNYKSLDTFMKISERDEDFVKDIKENDIFNNLEFPELLNFADVTDNLFNEFKNIGRVTLESEGLYIGNGIRYIKLDFNDTVKKIRDINKELKFNLILNKRDNDVIEKLTFPIVLRRRNQRLKQDDTKSNSFFVLVLDTDKFLEVFNKDVKEAFFSGYIEIGFEIGLGDSYKFEIAFNINMINPLYCVENTKVGVDFGTSSTCVAINKGRKLIAFTDNPETIEDYENSTSIIIFNWRKIYNQWVDKSVTIPHFNRSDSMEHAEELLENTNYNKEHYNYSNYIRKELKDAPHAKTINAIISEIKLLPEKLEDDRINKDTFIPFDSKEFKRKVYLTDNIDEENDETLNPIALYGYLIGRSLNAQIMHKIYVDYNFTMPVKFSKTQKDALLTSLEDGIKRSLPIWVREKVKVRDKYPESVALLGAAKKLKYLRLKDINEDAVPFAVFDFGGGTLDFSFGIYRKSVRDDRMIKDNEFKYKDMIEIFKIDGMGDVGGERIIDRLAYCIYENNKDVMKELEIPIIIPRGENKLNKYPENLLSKSHIAKLNLKNIAEKIAREYFIEGSVNNSVNVELFSIKSDEETEETQLQIPQEKLYEKLYEILEKAVENFKYILVDTFKHYKERLIDFGYEDFDINQIKIFQAGNASRNNILQEIFKAKFKDSSNIIFLESSDEDEMTQITPKNAVARGVLFLENTGYYYHEEDENGKSGLDRYIWFEEEIEEDGEDSKAKLRRGDTSKKDFEIVSRIDGEQFNVCYSDVAYVEDEDDQNLKFISFELDGIDIGENYLVYAKPYYDKFLEIKLGDEDGMDETSYRIDLDTGEIVKEEK